MTTWREVVESPNWKALLPSTNIELKYHHWYDGEFVYTYKNDNGMLIVIVDTDDPYRAMNDVVNLEFVLDHHDGNIIDIHFAEKE